MLVIVNNATVYIEVQMSLQHSDSTSFAYILRNRMLDLTAALFLILQGTAILFFHRVCTSLHSHQQGTRAPFSPLTHQHVLSFVSLIIAILTGLRWYLTVVLICISWMMSGDEHLIMYT